MTSGPIYSVQSAVTSNGDERLVIVDRDDRLHVASSWLQYLADARRSPNTAKTYASKVASYLSWTSITGDWRSASLSHLALWRRVVENSWAGPPKHGGTTRSDGTVELWMTAVRSFYLWADAEGLLTSDVAKRLVQLKYFAPGTPAGGESGRIRRVVAPELRPAARLLERMPDWIDDRSARDRLEALNMNKRDRFLIDLMYFSGIRAGEALSLFTEDMHLGGGSDELGCLNPSPHFHVRTGNATENGARAKGAERSLDAETHLVDRYIDYVLERSEKLGPAANRSRHVFVNLYSTGETLGTAMKYSGVRKLTKRCGRRIGFELTGPHMFRHTFATRLVRGIDCEQADIDVVQALLGHRSLSSTRIYTHDLEAAKKKALQSLAPRTVEL